MDNDMNILILSCGTRNKIVQYFKEELNGSGIVVATDCNRLAPALYEADKHYIVPKLGDKGYLEVILNICEENNIKAVFSLIDPELSFLAKNKQQFLEIGTLPIVSNLDVVEMCFDKYKMYEFLVQNEFPTIRSYIDKEQFYAHLKEGTINFPVFVKPVRGSASLNNSLVNSVNEIEILFDRYDNLMIQEYMDGQEFGIDAYIDMFSEETVAFFIKEKLKMRAGETDKSVSVINKQLEQLIKEFINKVGFKGVIDIDVFYVDEKFYISEVNPRFGGGFPHAFECGINIPKMIIQNAMNLINKDTKICYEEGVFMMKYNDIRILKK